MGEKKKKKQTLFPLEFKSNRKLLGLFEERVGRKKVLSFRVM